MLIPTRNVFRRTLMMQIAATRGGPVRLKILMTLENKPYNINEISQKLSLDYKTVQHHVRVLEKSGLISSVGKRYANAYTLSPLIIAHKDVLKEILANMGKSK